MIVEVYQCPRCKKEAHIADLNSFHNAEHFIKKDVPISDHKIVVLCLECHDTPVMRHTSTEVWDREGNVGAVII